MEKIVETSLKKLKAQYSQPQIPAVEVPGFDGKIVVLDDDSTGTQTVHDVPIYMDWFPGTIEHAFNEPGNIFFILTNSRSFTAAKSEAVHKEIAERLMAQSIKSKIPFVIISRSDSTLRGHWPLETEVLKQTLQQQGHPPFDAEIICPFFADGGRYTCEGIHYVAYNDRLMPIGASEFAKDQTFGYKSSRLVDWIEEKTFGAISADAVVEIDMAQMNDADVIFNILMQTTGFEKIVPNALYQDQLTIFSVAMRRAIAAGKQFLFRTAAPFCNALAEVSFKPILTPHDILNQPENPAGGLIVAGSHTQKTSEQLLNLAKYPGVTFVNFDQRRALMDEKTFNDEILQASKICTIALKAGKTVVLSTSRVRVDLKTGNAEDELEFAVKISKGLSKTVAELDCLPRYVMAKGGITASDVATDGLKIRRAEIVGQAASGVPVWRCGEESRFPGMGYIILPGNVGDGMLLVDLVDKLSYK